MSRGSAAQTMTHHDARLHHANASPRVGSNFGRLPPETPKDPARTNLLRPKILLRGRRGQARECPGAPLWFQCVPVLIRERAPAQKNYPTQQAIPKRGATTKRAPRKATKLENSFFSTRRDYTLFLGKLPYISARARHAHQKF